MTTMIEQGATGVLTLAQDFAATTTAPRPAARIPAQSELAVFTPDPQVLDANHIVGFNSRHISSRPFSLLRSQLIKRMQARGHRVVGVTSPAPGAGKSFLSANLAASLSRLPNRTVHVFDLDVRRASMAEYFGLKGEVGLEQYLCGKTDDLAKIGLQVEGTNLSLYPCYPNNLDTFELLAGDRFAALVAAMRALPEDSLVLCDLPPAFANDDAIVIADRIDAYLLVIEQGRTSQKEVKDCMRLLDAAECIGSVLNRYEGGFGDPYGYGYGYGSYGNYSSYFKKGD